MLSIHADFEIHLEGSRCFLKFACRVPTEFLLESSRVDGITSHDRAVVHRYEIVAIAFGCRSGHGADNDTDDVDVFSTR